MPTDPILDGNATTRDWQASPTRVAVWPVGAFEQHAARLPLCTDTLFAEHFARKLAQALKAALLPAMPYASSLEHTGFRGTVSLRPETLMQVVRDLAGNLERQGFTRLIIVNGHGGNFFLGPVVRDLNAQDGPLKILLVDGGREFDTSTARERFRNGELHAGASEISRLLAIRPDLVRDVPSDLPKTWSEPARDGFERDDLNTFGIGTRQPSGVWGDASTADAEAGRAMVASIEKNLLAHVRERLQWLGKQPHYAGTGGIALRTLLPSDVDAGLRLCRLAGWNQRREDWELFLRLRPAGCFAAVHMGRVVGTVTTVNYQGNCSWVGMVLVDPEHRRKGIGTLLLQQAIASLDACACIKLDATSAGKKVYDQLGFVDCDALERMIRPPSPARATVPSAVRRMREQDLPQVVKLDASAFGVERAGGLEGLFRMAPQYANVFEMDGRIQGFSLGRPGENFDSIGPLVAQSTDVARALVGAALRAGAGRPLGMDVWSRAEWTSWLGDQGFQRERSFIRMVRGREATKEDQSIYFAISGPELG